MTHICVYNRTTIGSDNGLSPGRRQAIVSTNVGILTNRFLETNFSEILFEILIFSFKKMEFKRSSVKWRSFRLGLSWLVYVLCVFHSCSQDYICVDIDPTEASNIGYSAKTHLKFNSREISFVHVIHFNCVIDIKICAAHGTINVVLCTQFQNDWVKEKYNGMNEILWDVVFPKTLRPEW